MMITCKLFFAFLFWFLASLAFQDWHLFEQWRLVLSENLAKVLCSKMLKFFSLLDGGRTWKELWIARFKNQLRRRQALVLEFVSFLWCTDENFSWGLDCNLRVAPHCVYVFHILGDHSGFIESVGDHVRGRVHQRRPSGDTCNRRAKIQVSGCIFLLAAIFIVIQIFDSLFDSPQFNTFHLSVWQFVYTSVIDILINHYIIIPLLILNWDRMWSKFLGGLWSIRTLDVP